MSSPVPQPIFHSTQDKFAQEIVHGGVPRAELKWLWNPLFVRLQQISASVLIAPNDIVKNTFRMPTASTSNEILNRAAACVGAWPEEYEGSPQDKAKVDLDNVCATLNPDLKRLVEANESAMETQKVPRRTKVAEIKPSIQFQVRKLPERDVIVISLVILFQVYRDYESRQEDQKWERPYEYRRTVEHKLMLGSHSGVGGGSTDHDESTRASSAGTSWATETATMTRRDPSVGTASSLDTRFSWRRLRHSLSLERTLERFNFPSLTSRNP